MQEVENYIDASCSKNFMMLAEIADSHFEFRAMEARTKLLKEQTEIEDARIKNLDIRLANKEADRQFYEQNIANIREKIKKGFKCPTCGHTWREYCSFE